MKCPYCQSKNCIGTNLWARSFANIVAISKQMALTVLTGGKSPTAGISAYRTSKALCREATYICLDCKKEFAIER